MHANDVVDVPLPLVGGSKCILLFGLSDYFLVYVIAVNEAALGWRVALK
jgi:hypothetical protein